MPSKTKMGRTIKDRGITKGPTPSSKNASGAPGYRKGSKGKSSK